VQPLSSAAVICILLVLGPVAVDRTIHELRNIRRTAAYLFGCSCDHDHLLCGNVKRFAPDAIDVQGVITLELTHHFLFHLTRIIQSYVEHLQTLGFDGHARLSLVPCLSPQMRFGRRVSSTLIHLAWEFSDFLPLSFGRLAPAC
jgi:hypothetical protein